jgi:threonine/homoserine/homoserine lactone efflux protein
MPYAELSSLVLFAVIGSFTPGPNTTMASITGATQGFAAAIPQIVGVPFGFCLLLGACALGLAGPLLAHGNLLWAFKWCGIAYLFWLAWHIATAPRPSATAGEATTRQVTRYRWWQAAVFQAANPKAWMLSLAAIATYGFGVAPIDTAQRVAVCCSVFSACCALSVAAWARLGATLSGWLYASDASGRRFTVFNWSCGALLAANALWLIHAH